MRIVIAPQEFKGSLTASEAAAAMAVGAREALPAASLEPVPMSDGGPGTVDAVVAASGGGGGAARGARPRAPREPARMSEGGPGPVAGVVAASGGRIVATTVRDPLGRP